ncbi:MAG: autoinducer binding domain-containing protein, partial [Candidatus Sedimenticola sp. (ex Thyasira tokunagai)]
ILMWFRIGIGFAFKRAMKDYNHVLSDFTEELRRATNMDEGFAALEKAVDKLGLRGVLYAIIPHIMLGKCPLVFKFSDSYALFLGVYGEARLDLHDPILSKAAAGETKVIDWQTERKMNEMTKKEREVFQVARDFQITSGKTRLLMHEKPYFAVSSIIGSNGDRDFYNLLIEREDIVSEVIRLFHVEVMTRWYRPDIFCKPWIDTLTPTQHSVLQGYLNHKTNKIIAREIGRSEGYIKNLSRDISKKLGGTDANGDPLYSRDQIVSTFFALRLHIPAHHEHLFRRNVNTHSDST